MPLYEYECTNCRKRFEIRQRMTEDPITVCPSCGGTTRRVLFPAGIIFKGSGWYVTDSRKSDASSTTASASSEKTSTETKKDTSATGSSTSSSNSDTTSKPAASTTT